MSGIVLWNLCKAFSNRTFWQGFFWYKNTALLYTVPVSTVEFEMKQKCKSVLIFPLGGR